MIGQLWQRVLLPFLTAYGVWLGIVWAWLLLGALVAAWTVWRARQLHRPRGWPIGIVSLLFPLIGLLWLRQHRRALTVQTNFGPAQLVEGSAPPLRPPRRIVLAALLGGLLPGLGQLVHGRILRALFLWAMLLFAGFFVGAHALRLERSWTVPEHLLPEEKRDATVSVHFRVPPVFYTLMLGELLFFLLFAYVDTVRLNDAYAARRLPETPTGQYAYYRLRVERPDDPPEERPVTRASLSVGSDERVHVRVEDERILPHHLDIYLHSTGEGQAVVAFRCLNEERPVHLNGQPATHGTLKPGDVLQVGALRLTFLPV